MSKRAIQPHVMAKATYFVDRVKAETLFQFNKQDQTAAVLEPYVYGGKAGEVQLGGMEKKLTNSGPFRESTGKHSIYPRLWTVLQQFPKEGPSKFHSAPVHCGNTRYW